MTKYTWIWIACCLLGPLTAAGQSTEARDFWIQHASLKYFDLPFGARSLGMGRSLDAVSRDVWNVFGNPAGLAALARPEASLQGSLDEIGGVNQDCPTCGNQPETLDENFQTGALLSAFPINRGQSGVLGVGIAGRYSDMGDFLDTDTTRYTATAAYGLRLSPEWNAGFSLSYIYDDEENDFVAYRMNDGFRGDLGVQFLPEETWVIGLQGYYGLGDIDSRIEDLGRQDGDRDAYGLLAGVSKAFPTGTLLAAAVRYDRSTLDAEVDAAGAVQSVDERGESWSAHAGLEQSVTSWLDWRAGYTYREIDYTFTDAGIVTAFSGMMDYHAASTGLGLQIHEGLYLNYAFEHRWIGHSDWLHALNLVYRF